MKVKRIIGIAVALVFMLSVFPKAPLGVKAETTWTVPDGYSEYEYNKLAAFLEIEDEDGVKNGTKLNSSYDVNDPDTWGYSIRWDDGYVVDMSFPYAGLVGDLDVSGFAELDMLYCASNSLNSIDASNCPSMTMLDCNMCEELTALNVTGSSLIQELACNMCAIESLDLSDDHSAIDYLDVSDNNLSFLDVSGCTSIPYLDCSGNNLTELDLSQLDSITQVSCINNPLKEIKLNSEVFLFESITAVGSGTVACYDYVLDDGPFYWHIATPDDGEHFIGWFDEEDNLLSEEENWMFGVNDLDAVPAHMIARFTEPEVGYLRGDADCNGIVNIADALAAMRHTMNIIPLSEQGALNADMDGSGSVDTTDALAIMRLALLSNN